MGRLLWGNGVVLLLALCGGCGGETHSAGAAQSGHSPLAAGRHRLTFSACSTARLQAGISGVSLTMRMPAGAAPPTAGEASGTIDPEALSPGLGLQPNALAFGSFSASTGTVRLSVATARDNFRGGEYLELLFTVAPGASVSLAEICALNPELQQYRVVGLDLATHSTVVMSGVVRTTLGMVGQADGCFVR